MPRALLWLLVLPACDAVFGLEREPASAAISWSPAEDVVVQQVTPRALSIDATHLYWLGSGTVYSVPLPGSVLDAPVAVVGQLGAPRGIAYDDNAIYWNAWLPNQGDGTAKHGKAGGVTSTLRIGATGPLAARAGRIYAALSTGGILAMQDDGSGVSLGTQGIGTIAALAVDETRVYLGTGDHVVAVDLAGNAPTLLAPSNGAVIALATIGDEVFYCDATSVLVQRKDARGAVPLEIGHDQASPSAIAVDGELVYWANAGTGEILAYRRADGLRLTLATGEGEPRAIAVANGDVFWANRGDGTIRVARRL